jgi:hypothetical protein
MQPSERDAAAQRAIYSGMPCRRARPIACRPALLEMSDPAPQ